MWYVSDDIKKEFVSKLVYKEKYLKTKVKSHGDEDTGFCDKEIPKKDYKHTGLVVISLDSAVKKEDKYYLQVFLIECKYTEKKVL